MKYKTWIRLVGIQFVTNCVMFCLIIVGVQLWIEPSIWQILVQQQVLSLPIGLIALLFLLAIAMSYGTLLTMTIEAPYEQLRAKINWLLLGKYTHSIFNIEAKETLGMDTTQLSHNIESIRQKMMQMSRDLQEFTSAPVFVGTETKEEIIEIERHRIARELHDSVSQELFAATMMLSAITENGQHSIPERYYTQLNKVEHVISNAQDEMRALLLHLRPTGLEGRTLEEGIAQLLIELQSKVGIHIHWELDKFSLDSGIENHLFRIVQEVISNTLRHAKAQHFEVYLNNRDNLVQLKMLDDGVGFDVSDQEKLGSYGLRNMRERIIGLGGNFVLQSVKGEGTAIEITIPIVF